MKKLLTQKEVEELVHSGVCPSTIGAAGEIVTPGARDYLRAAAKRGAGRKSVATGKKPGTTTSPASPESGFRWQPGQDPKSAEEIQAFFSSPDIENVKGLICDIGRRMWERGYVDGNSGNLTVRVGDNLVLCTPTLVSKGFMRPEHICLVDLEGNQKAGQFRPAGEVSAHLGIMKRQPKARACCYAHPPHATAYAVAKVTPPTCLIPNAEVSVGVIGKAAYETPGSPESAKAVGEAAVDHQAVLIENHGVVTWGNSIEDAYWKMENTDAYCKTVLIASMLGKELTPISGKQAKDMIAIRKEMGMSDLREDWEECELCDNSEFRPGFYEAPGTGSGSCQISKKPSPANPAFNAEAEKVVQVISDRIFENLSKK